MKSSLNAALLRPTSPTSSSRRTWRTRSCQSRISQEHSKTAPRSLHLWSSLLQPATPGAPKSPHRGGSIALQVVLLLEESPECRPGPQTTTATTTTTAESGGWHPCAPHSGRHSILAMVARRPLMLWGPTACEFMQAPWAPSFGRWAAH